MPSVILLDIYMKRIYEDYSTYIAREINDVFTDGHQQICNLNCCYIAMCYFVVIHGLGDL